MKTIIVVGLAAIALIGCAEEATEAPEQTADAMQEMTEMPLGDVPIEPVAPDGEQPAPTLAELPSPEPGPNTSDYGPEDIVFSVADRDLSVRLVLTPSHLTMKLSDASMSRLRSQVNERGLRDDLKNAILESVTEVALSELEDAIDDHRQKKSRHHIRYAFSDVNSIHFQGNRLWVDIDREKPVSFDDIKTSDGRSVMTNFEPNDARNLVAAFDSLTR